jgi:glycosyltransferase involved in cell wall biosynthesis
LAGRCREIAKYALVRPKRLQFFHIVSSERGAGEAAARCLQSVFDQDYPRDRVRHVFFDDASPDDTGSIVRSWLEQHQGHSVDFVDNTARLGAFANNLDGFGRARPGNVVLELNGDDWLPDERVLPFLNKVYADPDVWTTFNTFAQTDGIFPIALGPPRQVLATGTIRQVPWTTSALHTFRSELFLQIDPSSFLNPDTGRLWDSAHDLATYLPMIELAGSHSRHIYRTTYFYNLHEMNDQTRDRSGQLAAAAGIRRLPPHRPLETLTDQPPSGPDHA